MSQLKPLNKILKEVLDKIRKQIYANYARLLKALTIDPHKGAYSAWMINQVNAKILYLNICTQFQILMSIAADIETTKQLFNMKQRNENFKKQALAIAEFFDKLNNTYVSNNNNNIAVMSPSIVINTIIDIAYPKIHYNTKFIDNLSIVKTILKNSIMFNYGKITHNYKTIETNAEISTNDNKDDNDNTNNYIPFEIMLKDWFLSNTPIDINFGEDTDNNENNILNRLYTYC